MRKFDTVDALNEVTRAAGEGFFLAGVSFEYPASVLAIRGASVADTRLCDIAEWHAMTGDPSRDSAMAFVAFDGDTDIDALTAQVEGMTQAQLDALKVGVDAEYAVVDFDLGGEEFEASWNAFRASYGSVADDALDVFLEACGETFLGA